MKEYTVYKRPLFLKSGTVGLSDSQAKHREKDLNSCVKKGQFEITGEVGFKVGEKIGIDTKTAKSLKKTGVIA